MEPSSRRDLLRLGLAGVGGAWLGARGVPAGSAGADGDPLDRALERLHARASSDEHFLSNHVPMTAEALVALGRADAVDAWMDAHFEEPPAEAVTDGPVDAAAWREDLGEPRRFHGWRRLFAEQLADGDWRDVVRRWTPRLVPGLAGVATHGVIRTAHAVRAIEARDVAIRRVELGTALAYWAAFYEELPWDGDVAPAASVDAALAGVEPRRRRAAPPRGNIVAGLRALSGDPAFAPVAGRVPLDDPLATLSAITAAFARVFLANPAHRIHFTHAITAPAAVRLVAPYLDDEGRVEAARRAWQAAAGLYRVYHDPDRDARAAPSADGPPPSREEVTRRAVENGAPHAIKLVEACLREDALAPDAARLAAARDGARALAG